MARLNIFVIVLGTNNLFFNLLEFIFFNKELVFWFGYIWLVIGTILSIVFIVKGGCIGGQWYKERYNEDIKIERMEGVVELEQQTPRRDDQPGTALAMDTETNEGKILVVRNDVGMQNLFVQSYIELKRNKIFTFLFVFYNVWEFAIFCQFVKRIINVNNLRFARAEMGYPKECGFYANGRCVRIDLSSAQCFGQQNTATPIVFETNLATMGYVLPQCLDQTLNGYQYGLSYVEPVFDFCNYVTTRPGNEKLNVNNFNKYEPIQCFSFAQVTIMDTFFSNFNDLYIKATELADNRVYVQMTIADRTGITVMSNTQSLIDNMFSCVASKVKPAANDPKSNRACSLA